MDDSLRMVFAVFSEGDSLFIERIFFSLEEARNFVKRMPKHTHGEYSIFQYNGVTGEEVGEVSK